LAASDLFVFRLLPKSTDSKSPEFLLTALELPPDVEVLTAVETSETLS
jgi:hypothetical protein